MLHCIVKREKHPDRCIDEVIGPYETAKAADDDCTRLNANAKADGYPYEYVAWYLTAPEEA